LQHRQPQRGLPTRRAQRFAFALDQVERAAYGLEVARTRRGQLEAAVEAAEQSDAELVLEIGDPATDGRRRETERAGAVRIRGPVS